MRWVWVVLLAACNVGELISAPDATVPADAAPDSVSHAIAVTPGQADFGIVLIGSMSLPISVIVATGDGPAGVIAASVGGANANELAITSNNCTIALPARSTCAVLVVASPTSPGPKSATLEITGSLGGHATTTLLTSAVFADDSIVASPFSLGFGTITQGTTSTPMTATISNIGASTIGPIDRMMTGTNPTDFTVLSDGCIGGFLAGGQTCQISVRFAPQATGARSAVMLVAGNTNTLSIALSGTAGAPPPLSLAPSSFDFGSTGPGYPTTYKRFSLTNPSAFATTTLATLLSGSNAGSFELGSDTCNGANLAANASCDVDVRFSPATLGPQAATLSVGGQTASLSGTAVSDYGVFFATPFPLGFSDVAVGTTATSRTLTLQWNGPFTKGPLSVALVSSPPNATNVGDFTIVGGSCAGATLPAAATCTIDVTFTPGGFGQRAAVVRVTGNPNGSQDFFVIGNGVP